MGDATISAASLAARVVSVSGASAGAGCSELRPSGSCGDQHQTGECGVRV